METILNPITSFFKTNIPAAHNWIKNALAFVQRVWLISVDFVDTLPYWLSLTIHILFSLAVLGVLSAHFMGIVRAHIIWKKDPSNNLTRDTYMVRPKNTGKRRIVRHIRVSGQGNGSLPALRG